VIFHEWKEIWQDTTQKGYQFPVTGCAYLFGPPGWSHDGSRLTSEQMREGGSPCRDREYRSFHSYDSRLTMDFFSHPFPKLNKPFIILLYQLTFAAIY
jgi:hypothetical protein